MQQDIYYQPETCGLSLVSEVENAGNYEFDKAVIWKHDASGRVFYAFDSGCSCPSPFEDEFFNVNERGEINTSLNEATARNWEGAADELEREHFGKGDARRILAAIFR